MPVIHASSAVMLALALQVTELEYQNAVRATWGLEPMTQEDFDRERDRQIRQASEQAAVYEEQRLRGAGFMPATQLQKQGRNLVRATYSEPRLMLRMPGITLERGTDGTLLVTLTSDGRAKTGKAPVPEGSWSDLQRLEKAAFAPDPPPPPPPHLTWRPGDPLPPAVTCHGWGATLERVSPDRFEKVEAHGCNSGPEVRARLTYAEKLAEVALAAFPNCEAGEQSDTFTKLGQCFGKFEPSTSDNP